MSGSSISAASPSDGEREHPRLISRETVALFLCAKETCAHMWREEQMTAQKTPLLRAWSEQEQQRQAVRLPAWCVVAVVSDGMVAPA